jgi:hypothetical protein
MTDLDSLRKSYGQYYLAINPEYVYVPYQQEKVIPVLEQVARGEEKRVMIFMPPGHLFDSETLVPTPAGWKEHGQLKRGDCVFGLDGAPVPVTAVSEIQKADVRVILSDASEFHVHENHDWVFFDRPQNRWRKRSTKYFLTETKFGKAPQLRSGERGLYQLPLRSAIQYPEKNLALHPYVLGAWLGDGTSVGPKITFPEKDRAIIERIESLGYRKSAEWIHKTTGVLTASFGGEHNHAGQFITGLNAYRLLGHKHIPESYKLSSIVQRVELLAGLVDTDGYKDRERGRYRIVTVNQELADDIAEIVLSLGWHPCISVGKIYNPEGATIISKKTPYYIGFSPDRELPVVLERKRLNEFALRRRQVYIAEVERVGGKRTGQCIEIANPDGLYFVGKRYAISSNSKSDLATRFFTSWWMGNNPKKNVMVCSYAASLATDDFGGRIKQIVTSALHQAIFPGCRIDKGAHAKSQFRTEAGGVFYSVGFGGGVLGKRVDLMVLDDLIKNDDEADSVMIQDKLLRVYGSVMKSRLRPGAAVVLCMHRWRTRDIAGRILEMEGEKEHGGAWTVVKLPAEDPESGKFLWESYYGKKHYLENKRFEESWEAMWQQDPSASSSFWFRDDWLQFYDMRPPKDKFNNYMIIDPAISKEKHSDRTSIHVWAAGQDQKRIMMDWVLDKLDPLERAEIILAKADLWKPLQIIYEETGLNADTYFIRKLMEERDMPVRFYPISIGRRGPRHQMSKGTRIKMIRPLFSSGRIVLPKTFMYQPVAGGPKIDLTERFLHDEYRIYKGDGSVQHEDDLDNMSRLLEPELVMRFALPDPQEKFDKPTRYNRNRGISWQSVY